jgi:hypothetical protein
MPNLTPDVGPEPGPVEALRRIIDFQLASVHTSTPGQVVAFNAAKNQATVQPLLQRVFVNDRGVEQLMPAPILENVPVIFPRGGGFCVTWDLVVGDVVVKGLSVKLGGDGATLPVARGTDRITIDASTDPAFFAWLATLTSALPAVVLTPYTAPITGRITQGSAKVTAE